MPFTTLQLNYSTAIEAIKAAAYGLFIFLEIPIDLVHTLGILMMVDTGLGIIKALRLGDKVSFRILLWGMVTKLAVLIIPMILALIGKGLGLGFIWFVLTVLKVLIVAEGISCITNVLSIKSGKKIENTDYITALLHSIRKGLSAIIKRFLTTIEGGVNNSK